MPPQRLPNSFWGSTLSEQSSLWRRVVARHLSFASVPPSALRVICLASACFTFLLFVRVRLFGLSWMAAQSLPSILPKALTLGYYDFVTLAGLTLVFLLLLVLSEKHPWLHRLLFGFFCFLALLLLILGAVNAQVVSTIGRPFTYQWFYYSDFLRSRDAQSALFFNFPLDRLARLGVVVVAVWLAARSLAIELYAWSKHGFRRLIWSSVVALTLIYLPAAGWYLNRQPWDTGKIANPLIAFAESYFLTSEHQPALFTMAVSESFHGLRSGAVAQQTREQLPFTVTHNVKNVIIFVMESVSAEYIDTYGSAYVATPEIARYQSSSATFRHIYAHAPASNKSLVSILAAIYPWISYLSLTEERPNAQLPTLSSELKTSDYRTAFISASSTDFQRANEFLAYRQFDLIEDQATLDCGDRHYRSEQWSFLNGVDEVCAVDRLTSWLDEEPQTPFFAMLWSSATHYPYFTLDSEIDYGVNDEFFNRYLNALHHTDRAIGHMLDELAQRGLDESTLVVLVGDHGEAFGRHQQLTHASKIYEENIHIPLILINPELFHGEHYDTMGGLADIAPTVLSILQKPTPRNWQGYDLFRSDRVDRTYFFTPWSDFLFGYRQGNLKFIYNATQGTTEIYDLSSDPQETTNLAGQMPGQIAPGHELLAAWVQHQDQFFKDLLSESPLSESPLSESTVAEPVRK